MYWAIFGILFFAGIAMTVREGLWSNSLLLVNLLISGLAAFSFYSPLTAWLDEMLGGEYTYVLDFVLVWGLFVVAMVLCRVLTRMASATRLRFKYPIDPIGGPLMGICAAWVLASFTMATMHMAPMPKDAFGGRLVYENVSDVQTTSFLGVPDLGWLRFVQRVSKATGFGSASGPQFSAQDFVATYMAHREKLAKANAPWLRVNR